MIILNIFKYPSQDYRKGEPLYCKKIWTRPYSPSYSGSMFAGLELGSYVAKPTYKPPHHRARHHTFMHKPTFISYTNGTETEYCGALLNHNTFCRDIDGNCIYNENFVRLKNSHITGIVRFNPFTMSYDVAIIRDGAAKNESKHASLISYPWKLVSDTEELRGLEQFVRGYPSRVDLYNDSYCFDYTRYSYGCIAKSFIEDSQKDILQDLLKYKALIKTPNGFEEVTGYPVSLKERPGEYFILPLWVANASVDEYKMAIRHYYYLGKYELEEVWPSDKHATDLEELRLVVQNKIRKCVFASGICAAPVHRREPIFEGDLLINIDDPNIYGYLMYRPDKAQYIVEVPENLRFDKRYADGLYPVTKKIIKDEKNNRRRHDPGWELLWRLPDKSNEKDKELLEANNLL